MPLRAVGCNGVQDFSSHNVVRNECCPTVVLSTVQATVKSLSSEPKASHWQLKTSEKDPQMQRKS
jgi:hypothetical protein